MKKLLGALQSPTARLVFMLLAVVAAVWAIVEKWADFSQAIVDIDPRSLLFALVASFLYVGATMMSWLALLNDTGSTVSPRTAGFIFFPSQVAKYLPGGIWNFVAAAEAGAEVKISRRRSLTVMLTSMIVSVLSGLVFAAGALLSGPQGVRTEYWWIFPVLAGLLVLLSPPVLNRVVQMTMRLLKRGGLPAPFTLGGLGKAVAWAVVGWILAGLQVWVLMTSLGLERTLGTMVLATGAYALAWTVGFLVFFIPAGLGVREGILGLMLGSVISWVRL